MNTLIRNGEIVDDGGHVGREGELQVVAGPLVGGVGDVDEGGYVTLHGAGVVAASEA